ncbi:MAG: FAD-dependent oxidoreductase [Verrucomicrobia bacterium]|nr:FAD-dependent oxidoreductase [Verrucomicrobiota bacterium]
MDLLSPEPFWPRRDGLPATYAPLERDARCEVAIIGAGITGALVAWELADAGIDTIVLDRRETAHGSTAGSTSLLQYEIDEPLHRLMRQVGTDRAVRSYQRCRDAVDDIAALVARLGLDCGFRRRTSLLLASRAAHLPQLRREFEARRDAGFLVDWWPRSQLTRCSTLSQPAAILSHDAAEVDSYRLAHGLLGAAHRRGVRIHERTAVTRTRFTAGGVELKTARGGTVRARRLVIAAGYEAGMFLPETLTALHSTYAIVTHPVKTFSGWPADRCLIWETARPYLYLRTTEDDRMIVGGYDEPFRDPVARDRLLGAKRAALHRRLKQLFPRIAFEVAGAWAGTFAVTAHGLPYIGRHPAVPHTWFALGFGGNGVVFSQLGAQMIRDQIQGRANADEALFGFGPRRGGG